MPANPIEVAAEPFTQIDLWDISRCPNCIRPADEMPHFARTKFAVNFRRDCYSERIRNALCNLTHSHAFAAPDVNRQAIERVGFSGEQICARDVLNERKIACLFPIFIKDRGQLIDQAGAKNRDYAGVWIEDRLSRSVGTGITQRHRRDPDLPSPEQGQLFLIDFR